MKRVKHWLYETDVNSPHARDKLGDDFRDTVNSLTLTSRSNETRYRAPTKGQMIHNKGCPGLKFNKINEEPFRIQNTSLPAFSLHVLIPRL